MKNFFKNLFGGENDYEIVEPANVENAVRKYVNVVGRVQGVGFRFFVQQTALSLKVTGWVKNETDGSVSMEIQAEPQILDMLIEKIKRGNGYSNVQDMSSENLEVVKGENKFVINH
ncbi:MAG: acylphosphatase [Selenomonadaceae bacterium]|nr:acylphosphatase [Selenomonadaceae bacterium]